MSAPTIAFLLAILAAGLVIAGLLLFAAAMLIRGINFKLPEDK